MGLLNSVCEKILQFIIDNVDCYSNIDPETIYNEFSGIYNQRVIINALNELAANECINLKIDYIGLICNVRLLSGGEFYFLNKEQNKQPPNFNIINSTGINIGNNNSVSVKNGIDFAEAYNLIEKMDASNKEVLIEITSTLQDCLENSKPLPKGKFEKFSEFLLKLTPFTQLIGQLITAYLANKR